MGSTKIIHVLKNDGFDEVFDLFKNTDANEVIFVFPKGSKFSKQERYFEAIKREADFSGKKASVLTADPLIAGFASQNNLELLAAPDPVKRKISKPALVQNESNHYSDYEETETLPIAQLTAAKTSGPKRVIKDIFKPEIEQPIKINQGETSQFKIAIKREIPDEKSAVGDITQVWASREHATYRALRSLGNLKKIKSSAILKKIPLFFVGGAVVVLLLILYVTLGSARITIRPQRQPLNFQVRASASNTVTEINLDFNRMPGQQFSYKDTETDTFAATGQKDVVQKASGTITIFNKSASPQRLVATTRFKSSNGLIFRIPQTISVPAAIKIDSATQEGSIESRVYADKAGAEYNIGPTIFTIPGFEGKQQFNDFYARSSQPMVGGIIGPSKIITEEDFAKAQETVAAKLKERIIQSLKSQAGELKILDSTTIKLESPVTNVKVGEAAESLQMTIKGMASAVAFRESDVLELINDYISQKGDLELLEKNLTINYLNPQNNADNSIMTFDARVTGQSVAKINRDKILKDIPGMSEDAIRNYFKEIKEIESARIALSPFWVKSIPKNPSKIKLVIEKE